jgi:hypothetical protein
MLGSSGAAFFRCFVLAAPASLAFDLLSSALVVGGALFNCRAASVLTARAR